jgi:hypothetical protein
MRTPTANRSGIRFALLCTLAAAALASCHGDEDGTPPTVSVAALPATVSRTVTLTATATDNVGVTSVQFLVDGNPVGTVSSEPYTLTWNTGNVADGAHTITAVARDALNNAGTSAAVAVTVRNLTPFALTLSGREENPANNSAGTGSGTITVNLATGTVTGSINVSGFTSTVAHLHDAFAGNNGPVLIGFNADAITANRWNAPAGAALTPAQVDRLLLGALYFNVHSAQFPGGEVRAQLLPAGTVLYFTDLAGIQEVPEVPTSARGRGAVTVNTATRVAQIFVNTSGVDDATVAHLHRGAAGSNGPVAVGLTKDAANATRWFVENATLAQADFDALQTAGTYLNVHTPANTGGEIRGQVAPTGYLVLFGRLTGEQEAPAPRITNARGTVAVTVNTANGATDTRVNASGVDDAVAAHLHDAFAGLNGPIILNLEKDATNLGLWRSNAGTLTAAQIASLQEGSIYANVHTPAAPAGLIRGQVLPPNVQVTVAALTGGQEVPAVVTTGSGRASLTVNLTSRRATLHVNTTGLDTATAAHIHTGARGTNGPIAIDLTKDPATPRWFVSGATLTAAQFTAYQAGSLYVNVHTPANPTGEARGQFDLPGVAPLLFADIQARVFNSSCALSGCHSGATPPQGLNLTAASAYSLIVGVNAMEAPTLQRVNPGDAPASYLIRKLEGTPGILGQRMPLGRAPLPQNVVDGIKAWINAGALPAAAAPVGDTTPPAVTLGAVPATSTGTVALTATATDAVGVTFVRWRVNGAVVGTDTTAPYSFDWNSATVANGPATIDAQAGDAAGNVGTSALANTTVSNASGVTAFTFAQIQTQVLNVSCAVSGCHTGSSPPAGLDLSAPAYARLVNVASTEVPALRRIAPNDPANSYLIQKIEGTAAVGGRMPLGGPALDATTISRIRAWVSAGAPNN